MVRVTEFGRVVEDFDAEERYDRHLDSEEEEIRTKLFV